MKFTSIASGSSGNAYLIEANGVAPLLLEAGIPIRQLREKLSFGLSGLAGCLVSHEHQDHAKAVKDLLKAGIDCYMSWGTGEKLGVIAHHRMYAISSKMPIKTIGEWKIKMFDLKHDASEPLGFLIAHDSERLLFIPDTGYVKNRFEGITMIAIECNFISDILSENIQKGLPSVVGHRVRRNHMSLETLIEMLQANDLSRCRAIYLLHLSDGNSDERRMIKTVQEATCIPCFAA